MTAYFSIADLLTIDRFSAMLKESGLLHTGSVTSIQHEPVMGQFGKAHQLYLVSVQYAWTDSPTLPDRFFLKIDKSSKETFFYKTIARTMPSPPVIPCFFAAYDPEVDQTCLLLKDLSKTHFQTEWPIPPPDSFCFQIVEELAQIHSFWWEHARLESEFRNSIPIGRSWHERRIIAVNALQAFLTFLGDRISLQRREIYEHLFGSSDQSWATWLNSPPRTLLHGDLHVWNIFYPLDPSGNLCFFDWNMWDIGSPTDDLAYLIALHWYPERRRRLEQELLDAYHRKLVQEGVSNYPYQDFLYDYRVSVVRNLLLPVWQWLRGIFPGIWWPHLERIFLAFEDLKCEELF
jgi:hypothetical protein